MNLKEIKKFEEVFFRAPSAHNTQPWKLEYFDDHVKLLFDRARILPFSDPTNRDLLLSMGALIENILIVTSNNGFSIDFTEEIDISNQYVGQFKKSQVAYSTIFNEDDIKNRQSSRLEYEGFVITSYIENKLQSNLEENYKIQRTSSKTIREVFIKSDRYIYSNNDITSELNEWLRLSKSHPNYAKDGLNAECLNLSIIESYIFRLLLNMLKLVNVSKVITYFSMNIFKMESDVLLLTCNKDENSNILTGGRNLQRLWLSLAKEEIYTHPLSQIIDCTETSNMLKDLMKLDDNEKALAIFRVGKSKKPAYSPRL